MTTARDLTPVLTPEERQELHDLEGRIRRDWQAFLNVGEALITIRDKRLYRERHQTFDEYCDKVWHFTRQRAYQLMTAHEIAGNVSTTGLHITSERQARPLATLSIDDQLLVARAVRAATGKANPSGAEVAAFADVVKGLDDAAIIPHPDTREPVKFFDLPMQDRTRAVINAVQTGRHDRTTHQGTDDMKPWEYADGFRPTSTVTLTGDADGWTMTLTDRTTGETLTGPTTRKLFDAVRAFRARHESERPPDREEEAS